jgi:hypothetical protein
MFYRNDRAWLEVGAALLRTQDRNAWVIRVWYIQSQKELQRMRAREVIASAGWSTNDLLPCPMATD